MANEILVKSGTPVVWADVTDYAGDGGARTHQIDLTDLADGAARQGAKADLGATRAKRYAVTLCVEMAVVPAAQMALEKAGISIKVIKHFAGKIPVLGVCLGHQAIGQAFGGKVVQANRIMHGKTSPVTHDGKGVFDGLPSPFEAMRYHSLVLADAELPNCLVATARTDPGAPMGVRHQELAVEGVQFHPESIMTPDGVRLLKNFVSPDYLEMLRDGN